MFYRMWHKLCDCFPLLQDEFKDCDDNAHGDHHDTGFVHGTDIAQILVIAAVSLEAGGPWYSAFRGRVAGSANII